MAAKKAKGFEFDFTFIKKMKDLRKYQEETREALGTAGTGDPEPLYHIVSRVIESWPYDGVDLKKPAEFDELIPWQWQEVQDAYLEALQGIFRKPTG